MSKGDNFANGALVTRAGNAKKSSEELNGISESAQEQHEMAATVSISEIVILKEM